MKKALITGVTGQDGAYLAEFLLGKGYRVHGIKRRTSLFNTDRVDHLFHEPHEDGLPFTLHHGDMTDSSSLIRTIAECPPDEIYNLAAQSHVRGVVRGARIHRQRRRARHASPARGDPHPRPGQEDALLPGLDVRALRQGVRKPPQSETTPFHPRSPYGVAKLYAHWITVNYREAYGLFACNGILFNHESPIRGETFVTRKITRGLARIALGMQDCLYLGNLDARARLGPRARLRRGAVADASAAAAGGLRHRHRRAAERPRIRHRGGGAPRHQPWRGTGKGSAETGTVAHRSDAGRFRVKRRASHRARRSRPISGRRRSITARRCRGKARREAEAGRRRCASPSWSRR